MRPFEQAWQLLKSFDGAKRLPRRAKQMTSTSKDAEDIGMQAADSISREAEFHAQQEALREMGIHGAGLGFKNQPGAEFYSPLQRGPDGYGSSRSREERGLPPPTLQQQDEQASYYSALDPQNDFDILDHYAQYPTEQ